MKQKYKVYKDCKMLSYYEDGSPINIADCEFKLGDKEIIVSYWGELDERCLWRGKKVGEGHYVFKKEGKGSSGNATLHCFPKGTIYDGWWTEQDGDDISEGMWRIELKI